VPPAPRNADEVLSSSFQVLLFEGIRSGPPRTIYSILRPGHEKWTEQRDPSGHHPFLQPLSLALQQTNLLPAAQSALTDEGDQVLVIEDDDGTGFCSVLRSVVV
jgi:hypothetical protein